VNIVYAILVLGIMGAVFGLVLAIASKVFAVEQDARLEPLTAALPGANCGGCGYAGCTAYAQAVLAVEAQIGACAAGGTAVAAKMAEIMGVEAVEMERQVALVKCRGTEASKKARYDGLHDCMAATKVTGNGPNLCAYGCLGFGNCVAACKFDALHIVDGVARVDHDKCVGCFSCIEACPRNLIVKVPYAADIVVACSSKEKGASLRKFCNIGCIGCKICEKTCQHDAIHVIDNLAQIDYTKCVSCSECAAKCPRHLISDANLRTEFNTVEPKAR
jgi:RnfABCDGE-type electron transport complex B subunit